jgi:hypothetical protein
MNYDTANWDNSTYTCTFPSDIFFDVLYSDAGAVSNPQAYVVAARLSTKTQYDVDLFVGLLRLVILMSLIIINLSI